MKDKTFRVWDSYLTPNLLVVAELMGSSHSFVFESHRITITLPGEDNQHDCRSMKSRKVGEEYVPLEYLVNSVQVTVDLESTDLDIPSVALQGNYVDHSHFSTEQTQTLNRVLGYYSQVSRKAFLYWVDMLRWVSGKSEIGQPQAFSNDSGAQTYLIQGGIEKRIYSSGYQLTVTLEHPIGVSSWFITQSKISSDAEIPMYIQFMLDAKESIRLNYTERAIVELALSCENYLRYSVFTLLPSNLRYDFTEYIEEANINQFLNRFFKNSFDEKFLKTVNFTKLKKEISSLLDKRNKYMHMGKMEDATTQRFHRYLRALELLFKLTINSAEKSN